MKTVVLTLAVMCSLIQSSRAQQAPIRPIEPAACPIAIDSSFQTRCGYLVVPENRKKNNGKMIRLPFIVAFSKDPNKRKDPLLYTAGGPGGSSLRWITGAIRHSVILDRDCIAFEQRGTHFALPNLDGPELSDAIKESYRKNLSKDSMMLVGVKRYKAALEAKGIDLSGYNTDETVEDIEDLMVALKLDSVNLFGVSYSGGLMLDVLKRDPKRIRSLMLDSPLPNFIPIDQDEPANFNEALRILLGRCDRDSSDHDRYGNLYPRFQAYFNSIEGKVFTIKYLEKGTLDSVRINYDRRELLSIIGGYMSNFRAFKDVAYVITEMMSGRNDPFIRDYLDNIFSGNNGPSGMRLSVYCADQSAYHDEKILQQLYDLYPYMRGYHINDVYSAMCECWQVPPIRPQSKQPFYSDRPALLGDGELDQACRPVYIDLIHHYLPNSQRILVGNRGHVVFFNDAMDPVMKAFLDNPYQKVASPGRDVTVY